MMFALLSVLVACQPTQKGFVLVRKNEQQLMISHSNLEWYVLLQGFRVVIIDGWSQ